MTDKQPDSGGETIRCFHCPKRVRVFETNGIARTEVHDTERRSMERIARCRGSETVVKGNWRDDPTYRRG